MTNESLGSTPAQPLAISFRFDGGLASTGELNFYHAGRYRYAAARLLYTVENFRNSGNVLERLTSKVNADFRVTAAQSGSFIETAFLYAAPFAPEIQTVLSKIPFDKVLSWALDRVLPRVTTADNVANLAAVQAVAIEANARVSIEREKTAQIQAEQQTEQLRVIASMLKSRPNGQIEDHAAAALVGEIIQQNANGPAKVYTDAGDAAFVAAELQAETHRAQELEPYREQFEKLDPEDEEKLVTRVRRLVPEIALPLRSSAERFDVMTGLGDDGQHRIATLNQKRVEQIAIVSPDQETITMTGNIFRFDKLSGAGRFRPTGAKRDLPFSIPKDILRYQRNKFIDAFATSEVAIKALPYRDGINNIIKIVLTDVVDDL